MFNMSPSKKITLLSVGLVALMGLLGNIAFMATGALQGPTATASISANISAGQAPFTARFIIDVGPPSSPECADDEYILDFGDGTDPETGSSLGPTLVRHTYIEPDTYFATLTYTREENVGSGGSVDCEQATATDNATVNVLDPAPLLFIGTDGNWFDPSNWVGGQVPGPDDDVRINGNNAVVIDPNLSPNGRVEVRDIFLSDSASLVTLPGTVLLYRNLFASTSGAVDFQSSFISGAYLGFTEPGMRLNPSVLSVNFVDLEDTAIELFLGGTQPAAQGAVGPGHYANIQGGIVSLENTALSVNTIFDFVPTAGDEFTIVAASIDLEGTFANYSDGDVVATFGDVALVISYFEDRIVLTAQ